MTMLRNIRPLISKIASSSARPIRSLATTPTRYYDTPASTVPAPLPVHPMGAKGPSPVATHSVEE